MNIRISGIWFIIAFFSLFIDAIDIFGSLIIFSASMVIFHQEREIDKLRLIKSKGKRK